MTSLLTSLMSMKHKGQGNMREYIIEMFHVALGLKALKIKLFKELFVFMVLQSLLVHIYQFKISYNCQKEKWALNELISHCVQKEERLKCDKSESVHLVNASKDNDKKRKDHNEASKGPAQKKQQQVIESCFFCNKFGHVKKECTKYHV
ncbi:hypothetical protein J1N35_005113 [Gossypium stocksii]|uniref:CCHC-type domain-containing protein n=1 Tax=Gossypium stocksii TaxID=47602 RepID=A0A9D4AIP3_9ROSI|nr:hypothetical protein J1N35_005113 [Gossypium stocksii]